MNKKISLLLTFLLLLFLQSTIAQTPNPNDSLLVINGYQQILKNLEAVPSGITLGGYGEITYNQPEEKAGEMDVQRLILLVGMKFDERTQFVTEIEWEHVSQVFIEQAFLNYNLTDNINLRAGLMLVPMGIINEFHEPTTFNGVERPGLDGVLVPTTWREIGIGLSGRWDAIALRYQAYLFNGFLSYDESRGGILKGASGLRSGRQKGIQSSFQQPNLSLKADYYGILGLRVGLSYYTGKTQVAGEDIQPEGAVLGINMIGFDFRYRYQRWSMRGQYSTTYLSDVEAYNQKNNKDLGDQLLGYYLEAAVNVLPLQNKQRLDAFVRYENFNTHFSVPNGLQEQPQFHRKEWTFGLSYHLSRGTVAKMDYQQKNNDLPTGYGQFNMGIGVWF